MSKRKTWKERIAAAKLRGKFTARDRYYVSAWNTCAVGEVGYPAGDDIDAKNSFLLAPRGDHDFHILGTAFASAVKSDDIPRALELYARIQKAAAK